MLYVLQISSRANLYSNPRRQGLVSDEKLRLREVQGKILLL